MANIASAIDFALFALARRVSVCARALIGSGKHKVSGDADDGRVK